MYGTVTLLQIFSKFACRCTLENRWQPSLGWRWRWLPCEVGEYKFQARSSDPQQFALLLVSSIVLSWKWWMCSTLQLKRTGFFYICFLLLKAKCHIFGHQFSVVQLICLYLLVNSKGNSRSKLWQTQRQGGGEEILSHENGCASAASMRSRNMLMEQRWAWLLRELHARQVQTEPAVARVSLKTVFLKNFHCFWFKTQILRNYLPLVKTQNKNLVNNNLD